MPIVAVAHKVKDPVFQPLSAKALGSVLYNIFIAGALGIYGWYKIVNLFPVNVSALGTLMIHHRHRRHQREFDAGRADRRARTQRLDPHLFGPGAHPVHARRALAGRPADK